MVSQIEYAIMNLFRGKYFSRFHNEKRRRLFIFSPTAGNGGRLYNYFNSGQAFYRFPESYSLYRTTFFFFSLKTGKNRIFFLMRPTINY
jgi:hypothetical protein